MINRRRDEIIERIVKNIRMDDKTNCWIWQGATCGEVEKKRGRGYGRMSIDGSTMAVHRVVYTHFYGIIPNKKAIDHLCKNRLCCNPEHLEAVTTKENNRRKHERK